MPNFINKNSYGQILAAKKSSYKEFDSNATWYYNGNDYKDQVPRIITSDEKFMIRRGHYPKVIKKYLYSVQDMYTPHERDIHNIYINDKIFSDLKNTKFIILVVSKEYGDTLVEGSSPPGCFSYNRSDLEEWNLMRGDDWKVLSQLYHLEGGEWVENLPGGIYPEWWNGLVRYAAPLGRIGNVVNGKMDSLWKDSFLYLSHIDWQTGIIQVYVTVWEIFGEPTQFHRDNKTMFYNGIKRHSTNIN